MTLRVSKDMRCCWFCLTFLCFVSVILVDDGWTEIPLRDNLKTNGSHYEESGLVRQWTRSSQNQKLKQQLVSCKHDECCPGQVWMAVIALLDLWAFAPSIFLPPPISTLPHSFTWLLYCTLMRDLLTAAGRGRNAAGEEDKKRRVWHDKAVGW